MILAELDDTVAVHVDVEITVLNTGDVHFPDFDGGYAIKFGVIQTDMDAAFEGFVKFADAVCCQYEDTRVVFQHPEKHLRLLEVTGT